MAEPGDIMDQVETVDQLAQTVNKSVLDQPREDPAMEALCRRVAAQGMVLLKNEGVLPLAKADPTAYFGRVQRDYFYVGYGSGGDVHPNKRVSPMTALEARGDICFDGVLAELYADWCGANPAEQGTWGTWPTCHPEMPIEEAQVIEAARRNKQAVVILGRAMGEEMDNRLEKGYYYLTDEERRLLELVTRHFSRTVVVIDAGNILDLSWVEEYPIQALLYAFQGGMESGNALVDVLYGETEPGGRLTDTIARHYGDYPGSDCFGGEDDNEYREDIYVGYRYFETFARENVLFPFGFGLGYTSFSLQTREADPWCLEVEVCNTGSRPGRQVVQLYLQSPQALLGKPLRSLIGYQKTGTLQPGETEVLRFPLEKEQWASFDDSGITGYRDSYVLEAGCYQIYVGTSARENTLQWQWTLPQTLCVQRLTAMAAPKEAFVRCVPVQTEKGYRPEYVPVPVGTDDRKARVEAQLPEDIPFTGDRGYTFSQLARGEISMEAFLAQLTAEELEAISRGEGPMDSTFGTAGNAGMMGGTVASLREKGIPTLITTDGPAGIRLRYHTALLPCGTALASSWDEALVEELGTAFGREMARLGSDILLGPGMNIHRNPLCGRNFEYFSEDPLLSGKIGAAMVRGIQHEPGRAACAKHFACNNQETRRQYNDSKLSQRALREIYLRGFEICVKEAAPKTLMTSYNKINGVWGHYQFDLVQGVLRGEWGYRGLVMTDWWMQPCKDPDFPGVYNDGYRVRGGIDVLMPGGLAFGTDHGDESLLHSMKVPGGVTLGEMQRVARRVLERCLECRYPEKP